MVEFAFVHESVDAAALGLAFAHKLSQGLIVRVNTPLCNEAVEDYGAPGSRHFPKIVAGSLAITCVSPAGTAKDRQTLAGLKEFFGVNLIIRNRFEVSTPALAHLFSPDEALTESILKNVSLGHELTNCVDVARIDAVDEVHRYV